MISWLFDWLKSKLGHWLLKDEDEYDRRMEEYRAKRMREIIEDGQSVDDVERDLRSGDF